MHGKKEDLCNDNEAFIEDLIFSGEGATSIILEAMLLSGQMKRREQAAGIVANGPPLNESTISIIDDGIKNL